MKLNYLSTLLLFAVAVSIATLLMTDSFAIRDMHHRLSSNTNDHLSFPGLRVRPPTTMDSNSKPTILELVGDSSDYKCPDGLVLVKDSIDPSFYEKSERKIPKVVHMTSKTRCMTKLFAENIDKWRFKGHSLFLHDDDAVDRLLKLHWPEFPQLQTIMKCMFPGASIADLWRSVLLWEYGGIYTDIDNTPGPRFLDEKTGVGIITNETDALFEQENQGFPSQYFFASSPHHPIMFLAVYQTMHRVMEVASVKKQYVPFVTGPGAIKSAFIAFAGGDGYPMAGVYPGLMSKNHTVTIIGSRRDARKSVYVHRSPGNLDKRKGYREMNITGWGQVDTSRTPDKSCMTLLSHLEEEARTDQFRRHLRA